MQKQNNTPMYIVISALVLAVFVFGMLKFQKGKVVSHNVHDMEMTDDTTDDGHCTMSGGNHAHTVGLLEAKFDAQKRLTGWLCIMSSHHVFKAGPDGVFITSSVPPEFGWANPVSKAALEHPELYTHNGSEYVLHPTTSLTRDTP